MSSLTIEVVIATLVIVVSNVVRIRSIKRYSIKIKNYYQTDFPTKTDSQNFVNNTVKEGKTSFWLMLLCVGGLAIALNSTLLICAFWYQLMVMPSGQTIFFHRYGSKMPYSINIPEHKAKRIAKMPTAELIFKTVFNIYHLLSVVPLAIFGMILQNSGDSSLTLFAWAAGLLALVMYIVIFTKSLNKFTEKL